ncbi:MAG: hypothetical protein JXP73_20310 [Deltaproteobacteria bacterium]|nr:hypothetical protein [Deltaproteobacteria bacterium]
MKAQLRHGFGLGAVLVLGLAACTTKTSVEGGAGGVAGSGGATGGTMESGGTVGSGGAASTGGSQGSGGAVSTGGSQGSGGSAGSGGDSSTGGAVGSGGAMASGGAAGSGGDSGSAGAAGSGGETSSGGSVGSGGETGSGGAESTGGQTGAGGASGAGGATTTGTFEPLCTGLTTVAGVAPAKNGVCTDDDPQLCYKTCGPQSIGFKSETCTDGVYVEQSGCSFPAGVDYSCYKIPETMDASCPTTAPQSGQACDVAACTLCNVDGGYLDSSGNAKTGYCVCPESSSGSGKWSCASTTAWPCPGAEGC